MTSTKEKNVSSLLTPHSRVLEKLTVVQLVWKFILFVDYEIFNSHGNDDVFFSRL